MRFKRKMLTGFDNIFIWAQIVGFIALCFSIAAWQMKKPEHILMVQIPNSALWCLQYTLLASPVAVLSSFFCIFKDIGVIKAQEKYLKYIVGAYIGINFIAAYLFYESIFSILPVIVSLLVNLPLLKKDNRRWMARGTLVSQICWIAFNLHVGAYMGIIGALLVATSTIIGMYRYENWNFKKGPKQLLESLIIVPQSLLKP